MSLQSLEVAHLKIDRYIGTKSLGCNLGDIPGLVSTFKYNSVMELWVGVARVPIMQVQVQNQ